MLETSGKDELILGTAQGMSIMFSEEDVRDMGRTAMGVKAAALREGDRVVGIGIVREGCDVLVISENGYGKRTSLTEYKVQRRGGIGIKTLNVTDKTGEMCALGIVDGSEDIWLINDAGIIIRTRVGEISVYGRDTQGVRLMNVDEESRVVVGWRWCRRMKTATGRKKALMRCRTANKKAPDGRADEGIQYFL